MQRQISAVYSTVVPGSDTGFTANSSPRFTNYPPVLLCNNDELVFNHLATDPDGDQLIYSLVTPWSGASSANPLPTQAPAPPSLLFPPQFPAFSFLAHVLALASVEVDIGNIPKVC